MPVPDGNMQGGARYCAPSLDAFRYSINLGTGVQEDAYGIQVSFVSGHVQSGADCLRVTVLAGYETVGVASRSEKLANHIEVAGSDGGLQFDVEILLQKLLERMLVVFADVAHCFAITHTMCALELDRG